MKKILLIMLCMIFLVAPISALDFDNGIKYEDKDMKVIVEDGYWFGIGEWIGINETLGTATLKSHNAVTHVLGVGWGEEKVVTYYDFNFLELYKDGLGKVKFTDMNTGKSIDKDYYFVEWVSKDVEVNDYAEICNKLVNGTNTCYQEVTGTHLEERGSWVRLKENNIPVGNSRIGLKTYVEKDDYIDGVWTIAGKEVKKHITWSGDIYAGLIVYLSADEPSGSLAKDNMTGNYDGTNMNNSIAGGYGKLGAGLDFSAAGKIWTQINNSINFTDAFTFSFWINRTWDDATDDYYFVKKNALLDSFTIFEGAGEKLSVNFAGLTPTTCNTYNGFLTINESHHVVIRYNSTNITIYRDGILNMTCANTGNTADIGLRTLIGSAVNWNLNFKGIIDEIAIANESWSDGGCNTGETCGGVIEYIYNSGDACAFGDEFCAIAPPPTINLDSPANLTNSTIPNITFNATIFDIFNITNVSFILDNQYNETNLTAGVNDSVYTFNKIISDGDHWWTMESCNFNDSCDNASQRTFTIDTINPAVVILAPPETIDSHVLNTNIFFNWSANDTNLDACVYGYGGANTTATCSDNTTTINITNASDRIITFWVNDTFGNINVTTRTWSYNFIETGSSFTADVFETKNYTFAINITSYQTITSLAAFLKHNGTTYAADASCGDGDCEISAHIDIPLLNTGQTAENKTFYWQLSIFNGTGTSNINTSTQQQNVTAINLKKCVTPNHINITSVNFTIHNETDRSALIANFNAYFQYYLGTGSVYKEGSSSQTGGSVYDFCIDQNETFYTTSKIDLSATSYEDRHYDFTKQSYTNTTTIQPLYLLNSTFASIIIIEVKDQGLVPKPDILVNISRFYPGTGRYYPIESQITDEFGQIIAKLIENDAKYKFAFYDLNGNLLKTSEDITIACRSVFCVIPFVLEDTTDEFERFENLTTYSYTFAFDNTTNMFAFSWDDQRGESATTRLEVIRYLLNGSSVVCNTSSTSILSTLTCDVGGERASYKAQAFRVVDGKSRRISILNIKVADPASTYGVEGLLWVFILLMTMVGVGAYSPPIAAGLYGIGFLVMGVLGVISMPVPVFFANTILVILFIWAVSK